MTTEHIAFHFARELSYPCEVKLTFTIARDNPSFLEPGKKVGEILFSLNENSIPIAHISLGIQSKISAETFFKVGKAVGRWIVEKKVHSLDATDLDYLFDNPAYRRAFCEGLMLGAYAFDDFQTEKSNHDPIDIFLQDTGDDFSEKISRLQVICETVNSMRDLINQPGNVINPNTLEEIVVSLVKKESLHVQIIKDEELEQLGAGGIISVGKGSQSPPRFIVLENEGARNNPEIPPMTLIGKTITFDSGGYSIKDSTHILGMKYDKAGGIIVLGTLLCAARLGLEMPLVGIISAAENMISHTAYRPDDIIRTMSGKTVEIITTDAEGRLVLADAITYAQKNFHPKTIIDIATLTGGVITALGHSRAAVLSNDDKLADILYQCGESVFERLWRLPIDEELGILLKGCQADLKNSGGRDGQTIQGAMFLKNFYDFEASSWAHLDIAGVADIEKETQYAPRGATGFGIRLLVDFLSRFSNRNEN